MGKLLPALDEAIFTGDRDTILEALRQEPSAFADGIGDVHRVILRHLTHVLSDHSMFAGVRLADYVNCIRDAFFNTADGRPGHLSGAAGLCSGQAPFAIHLKAESQIEVDDKALNNALDQAAATHQWEQCEKCLFAIRDRRGAKQSRNRNGQVRARVIR